MLLSYNDNKLKLLKSLNESFLIQEISFAFSNNNCNDVSPLNTPAGSSLILFPYKTIDVNDLSPAKASWETREMLLFDKSIRRSLRWFANALVGISVM